jgi:hypothetical protein
MCVTHLTQNEQNEEARDFEKSINSKSAEYFINIASIFEVN